MPFHIDSDIALAHTPPGQFYLDPELYRRSIDGVFARSWQFIGDTDSVKVPGAVHPVTMLEGCLDEPLVLTRDMDDEIHLLSNVCTHRANLVVESPGNERFLRCRYHGRRFAMDGTFQHMPEFEGVDGFPCEKDHLAKVPFGTWGKLIFASTHPEFPLDELLRPIKERVGWLPLEQFYYEPSRARDYLIRANWALYCDNYLEGFHIPFIHADLNATIDYGNYTVELFPYCNLQLAPAKGGEDVFDLPESSPDYGSKISAYYWWLFPNMMLNFYPWGLSINVVKPLGPDLTKVSFLPYVWDSSKLDRGAGGALDRVEREDEVVVELVHKGLKSRFYDTGRYSPAREQGTHHFHSLLAERYNRLCP